MKIFVSSYCGDNTDISWIGCGNERCLTIEESDLVVFTKGPDVEPNGSGYGRSWNILVSKARDNEDMDNYRLALTLKKKILGIERGAQLICIMNGGFVSYCARPHPINHINLTCKVLNDGVSRAMALELAVKSFHNGVVCLEAAKNSYSVLGICAAATSSTGVEDVFFPGHCALAIQSRPSELDPTKNRDHISLLHYQSLVGVLMKTRYGEPLKCF